MIPTPMCELAPCFGYAHLDLLPNNLRSVTSMTPVHKYRLKHCTACLR